MKIAELANTLGVEKINEFEGAWLHQLDDNWTIAVNGHSKKIKCDPEGTMGADIPPYSAAVWWNGWLAGLISPGGGTIAAGELANEDTFIEALERKINE